MSIELPINSYKIDSNSGCWIWVLGKTSAGYGVLYFEGRPIYAHRASAMQYLNMLPDSEAQVLHTCDTPSCVNPDHLFLGTNHDNHIDKTRKLRAKNQNSGKTHCNNGHSLDPTLEHVGYDSSGDRFCKTCKRDKERERYHKKNPFASNRADNRYDNKEAFNKDLPN